MLAELVQSHPPALTPCPSPREGEGQGVRGPELTLLMPCGVTREIREIHDTLVGW